MSIAQSPNSSVDCYRTSRVFAGKSLSSHRPLPIIQENLPSTWPAAGCLACAAVPRTLTAVRSCQQKLAGEVWLHTSVAGLRCRNLRMRQRLGCTCTQESCLVSLKAMRGCGEGLAGAKARAAAAAHLQYSYHTALPTHLKPLLSSDGQSLSC